MRTCCMSSPRRGAPRALGACSPAWFRRRARGTRRRLRQLRRRTARPPVGACARRARRIFRESQCGRRPWIRSNPYQATPCLPALTRKCSTRSSSCPEYLQRQRGTRRRWREGPRGLRQRQRGRRQAPMQLPTLPLRRAWAQARRGSSVGARSCPTRAMHPPCLIPLRPPSPAWSGSGSDPPALQKCPTCRTHPAQDLRPAMPR
mmetsp:Transcript_14453/g.23766  ORF Transcript_14453/g.23766 Transcript_14453/m.23766 type:complete len:204 (+) Transcript_14453:1661-2272(+)